MAEEEREGKEGNKEKEKQFRSKPRQITIHAPHIKEDDVEMNQMMWQNHDYNCQR
jgi:hypothetical protein